MSTTPVALNICFESDGIYFKFDASLTVFDVCMCVCFKIKGKNKKKKQKKNDRFKCSIDGLILNTYTDNECTDENEIHFTVFNGCEPEFVTNKMLYFDSSDCANFIIEYNDDSVENDDTQSGDGSGDGGGSLGGSLGGTYDNTEPTPQPTWPLSVLFFFFCNFK